MHIDIANQTFHQVADRLFVGPAPVQPAQLRGHFQAVLDCRHDAPSAAPSYAALGIAYTRLPFPDGGPCPPAADLERALTWLAAHRAAGDTCLVHCQAGVSRSPFIVSLALLPAFAYDVDRTLAHVKRCRPLAAPAAIFVAYLRVVAGTAVPARETGFAAQLRAEAAAEARRRG